MENKTIIARPIISKIKRNVAAHKSTKRAKKEIGPIEKARLKCDKPVMSLAQK